MPPCGPHALTHAHTHSHTHTHVLTNTHNHTQTLTHTHTFAHTHSFPCACAVSRDSPQNLQAGAQGGRRMGLRGIPAHCTPGRASPPLLRTGEQQLSATTRGRLGCSHPPPAALETGTPVRCRWFYRTSVSKLIKRPTKNKRKRTYQTNLKEQA